MLGYAWAMLDSSGAIWTYLGPMLGHKWATKSWPQLGPPWSNGLTELAGTGFLPDLVLLQ